MTDPPAVARPAWADRQLAELLAEHGLTELPEQPFPNDGWSGATLSLVARGSDRFILKRTSWAIDWIARNTADHELREAVVAAGRLRLPAPAWAPFLGVAADGDGAAILMPDLSEELLAWERPAALPPLGTTELDRIFEAIAGLHALGGEAVGESRPAFPWCPVPIRVGLCSRRSAERYLGQGLAFADRFVTGWDAFDRFAPASARDLVAGLSVDPGPLVRALARLPASALHGDLKLANVALMADGRVGLIDWQLATFAPVAVELGWFLVSNVADIAEPPDAVLERYRSAVIRSGHGRDQLGDWDAQVDLAILVGLAIRGWRKGHDAEAGLVLPTGVGAVDDLRWWSERAVDAAGRRL